MEAQLGVLKGLKQEAETAGFRLNRRQLDVLIDADRFRKGDANLKIIKWDEQPGYVEKEHHDDCCNASDCPEASAPDLCCCSICSRVYHGACLVPPISKSEWQDKVKEWICGECCKRDMLPLKAQLEVESAAWD